MGFDQGPYGRNENIWLHRLGEIGVRSAFQGIDPALVVDKCR